MLVPWALVIRAMGLIFHGLPDPVTHILRKGVLIRDAALRRTTNHLPQHMHLVAVGAAHGAHHEMKLHTHALAEREIPIPRLRYQL